MECACLNTRIRYMAGMSLENPDKEIKTAGKIYTDICPKINEECERADWIKKSMSDMSFLDIIRKKNPTNTGSTLLNTFSNEFNKLDNNVSKVEKMFFEGQLRWRGYFYGHIERR